MSAPTARTVTVSGTGTAYAVPDSAVVSASIGHRAATVAEALAGVNSAADAAVAAALTLVEQSAIATRDLNLWPAHDNQGRPSGFECRHALAVRCESVEVASRVIGVLAEAVGDRLAVESVALVVSDQSAAQAQAREAAYADAVGRATHLATLAGTALGEPVTVVEGGGGFAPYAETAAMRTKADASFEPGQTAIGATVSVTFALT